MADKTHFINGQWLTGRGDAFSSTNPATGQPVWSGAAATPAEVDQAVAAARAASEAWGQLPIDDRIKHLRAFAARVATRQADLTLAICREVGKPRWDAASEVAAMINKVEISIDAYRQRCQATPIDAGSSTQSAGSPGSPGSPASSGATRFKPHGVVAVFGPFNFPAHLPNGHIVPALLAGNTVVFKPSEMTPGVARVTLETWEEAGIPPGVLNLVQGARPTGSALAMHRGIDGIFFTGSVAGGLALRSALADWPQKILALEMGGNNPLIVHEVADLDAAAYVTVQSAFLTSGQRCTCARRLIVPRGLAGDAFIGRLAARMARIKVGPYTDEPEPFMGPVISARAADAVRVAQQSLVDRGGLSLVEARRLGAANGLVTPGLIDVTAVQDRPDAEVFGPLLQLIRVDDFDAAIAEANHTVFGLSAGLLCDRRELFETFYRRIRSGVVNWNRQLTNASSKLPFGGVGRSGNHRPSGYFAADYCSYPVALMEVERLAMPDKPSPGHEP